MGMLAWSSTVLKCMASQQLSRLKVLLFESTVRDCFVPHNNLTLLLLQLIALLTECQPCYKLVGIHFSPTSFLKEVNVFHGEELLSTLQLPFTMYVCMATIWEEFKFLWRQRLSALLNIDILNIRNYYAVRSSTPQLGWFHSCIPLSSPPVGRFK